VFLSLFWKELFTLQGTTLLEYDVSPTKWRVKQGRQSLLENIFKVFSSNKTYLGVQSLIGQSFNITPRFSHLLISRHSKLSIVATLLSSITQEGLPKPRQWIYD
jgi:hypothetical protein